MKGFEEMPESVKSFLESGPFEVCNDFFLCLAMF